MYSRQFINKVLTQRAQQSINKLSMKYEISTRTIQNWIQGKLPQGRRHKLNTKLNIDRLIEDINMYNDSYSYERANRLGVSTSCIKYNMKKLRITYKKNPNTCKSLRREATCVSRQDKTISKSHN